MPTIRIISLKPDYDRLTGHRRDFAAALRAATSNTLHENIESVEALWLAPIDPDDAVNVLPYSIDVEFSTAVNDHILEQLANTILDIFMADPYTSRHIPSGTQVGAWIKTPGRFYWKETIKKAEQIIGVHSQFSFFDGDRLLVLVAPDHPDAPYDERHNEHCWEINAQTGDGELLAKRYSRKKADPDDLWSTVSSGLYQSVSSNEVNRLSPEIKVWLQKVHAAYQTRSRATTA